MSLSISMVKAFPGRDNFIMALMACFASFTPIGLVIGMLIADAGDLMEIIFSTLAAGTFMYIACSEVIIEEFSIPDHKWLKLVFFVLGICMITALLFLNAG